MHRRWLLNMCIRYHTGNGRYKLLTQQICAKSRSLCHTSAAVEVSTKEISPDTKSKSKVKKRDAELVLNLTEEQSQVI